MNTRLVTAIAVGVAVLLGGIIFAVSGDTKDGRKAAIGSATITISGCAVTEGNAGALTGCTFDIKRSSGTGTATVYYDTANSGGTSATSGTDYVAKTGQVAYFASGVTSKKVTVTVNGDNTAEPDESFLVKLSAPSSGHTISSSSGTGVGYINNDDTAQGLSVNNLPSIVEGNSGTTSVNFRITRAGGTSPAATVYFSTANGTAKAPDDFEAVTNRLVTFNVGDTYKDVPVTIVGDIDWEEPQSFTVQLSNPSGVAIVDGSGTGTIAQDQDLVETKVSVEDMSITEGNSGTKVAKVKLTRNNASYFPTQVNWMVSSGTANSSDYTNTTSGNQVWFASYVRTVELTFNINGDTVPEPNETINITVSNPQGAGAAIGRATGTASILNDD